MRVSGIDYSMTTPCICTGPCLDTFEFRSTSIHFLTNKEKMVGKWLGGQIIGKTHLQYDSPEQRFNNIAMWAMNEVYDSDFIVLEGYAMGAKGLVFHIGENTGLLKNRLWYFQKKFQSIAPTTIKKFATGKGNAKKENMYDSFFSETSVDLLTAFSLKKPDSPINDIVDAFYAAKYAWHLIQQDKK